MISRKHKSSIHKLISSTDVNHWSLALQILTGQLNRNNAESMILQYIINIHNFKLDNKLEKDINHWATSNFNNIKLRQNFFNNFKYSPYSPYHHNGKLTLNELEDWFNTIIKTPKKKKSITLHCGPQIANLFDELIKEEINAHYGSTNRITNLENTKI